MLGLDQSSSATSKRTATSPPPDTHPSARPAQPAPRAENLVIPLIPSDGLSPEEAWEDKTLKQIYRVALQVGILDRNFSKIIFTKTSYSQDHEPRDITYWRIYEMTWKSRHMKANACLALSRKYQRMLVLTFPSGLRIHWCIGPVDTFGMQRPKNYTNGLLG